MKERGAIQVEECRLFTLHAAVFAQIEIKRLLNGRPIFVQLEAIQLAIEIRLDRRLADPLGQLAYRRANVDLRQRFLDGGQLPLAEQRHGGIAQIGQRRGEAVLQRREGLRQPDPIDHFRRRAMGASIAQMARDP